MTYDSLSIYLAKLIGTLFIILGFAIIIKRKDFQKTVKDFSQSDALVTLISILPIVGGLAIILAHNLWESNWTIFITVIGWIMFIIGLIRLFFHQTIMKKMKIIADKKGYFLISGIILFILGIIIAYYGFYA